MKVAEVKLSYRPKNTERKVTEQIKEAAKILRITVLDHIIVTDKGYCSFRDEGII